VSAAYGNFYLPYIYMGDLDGALTACGKPDQYKCLLVRYFMAFSKRAGCPHTIHATK